MSTIPSMPVRTTVPSGPPIQRPRLARIPDAQPTAPRIILNAVEGWGKTTYGAYAPNPAILMARGETGYETLRKAGRVPDCDCVELSKWTDVLTQIDDLRTSKHGAVILDALGGFERLCHEHMCFRDFGGDWGERGFASYQKGFDVSVAEWLSLLAKLDRVRADRGIPIVLLSHAKVVKFDNPMGSNFDRYVADCHAKTWGVTHKWADAVLFGTYVAVTVEDKKTKKTKGIGGDERVLFATRRDAYDAKNRYGLDPQMNVPEDPSATWGLVWDAIHRKPEVEGGGT